LDFFTVCISVGNFTTRILFSKSGIQHDKQYMTEYVFNEYFDSINECKH